MVFSWLSTIVLLGCLTSSILGQNNNDIPNSFPHDYPGKPSGDFSPVWQDYFLVKDSLPNITFPINRNFAGNIPVNRAGHPNDTLFFWAFEQKQGSLTASTKEDSTTPWGIWLNGGPGASSLLGLLLENGPLHVTVSGSMESNPNSWDKFVDYIWVDSPVGTGYSTADRFGYIADEDQMAEDFIGFLSNVVKVFPSLAKRPLLLTGESYAGTYIPYITKALFSMNDPPVKLAKIAIGDGTVVNVDESEQMPALQVVETYPQLIGYDPEVHQYFKEQTHLCGFDFNLTYPQHGLFPPIVNVDDTITANFTAAARPRSSNSKALSKSLVSLAKRSLDAGSAIPKKITRLMRRQLKTRDSRKAAWKKEKRDLSGRANGTIDPFYGCFLMQEVYDYANNFSFPWNASPETSIQSLDDFGPLDFYDIPDGRNPPLALDPTTFLNDNRTRAALHAPTSKDWILQFNYPFNSTDVNGTGFAGHISPGANDFGDPSPAPIVFLSELATNASKHGVTVIIYSGNDDSVVAHYASEVAIQNTTFGGIQGFSKKPQTPFTDDSGKFAGIVHQERGWVYALFDNAGHEVPEFAPEAAFVFFRDFILGDSKVGLVESGGNVVGGEGASSLLVGDILYGTSSILFGNGTSTSLFAYPSATIASWEKYFSSVVEASSAELAKATITQAAAP
ncbi:alpha/beta-hydrolase [Schizopora paradoxa]|uniref:Carboxypeptidase n=1 Tax=Schizopora paradoxa TaxID=27342 RepID=A0A0H2R4D9_9AGAM|nr:alpha/beta-hydrolase [Schizopora paradoxa]